MQGQHLPVMAAEVLSLVVTRSDGIYVDCTIGGGGHARGILNGAPAGRLLGIDLDSSALEAARLALAPFGSRVETTVGNFSDLASIAQDHGYGEVDGVLFDLGFSSLQLDDASRGLSFSAEGPLDMRLDTMLTETARDVIHRSNERELAGIPVFLRRSSATTRFVNEYDEDGTRRQVVTARADDVGLDPLPDSWRDPDALLLGPLVGELGLA